MSDYALLFCGFSRQESEKVTEILSAALENELQVFSAAAGKDVFINRVLEGQPAEYSVSDRRFMMFLGFDDAMIKCALSAYPADVKRPIFCGLTENNYNWNTEYLLNHLVEEENAMNRRTE